MKKLINPRTGVLALMIILTGVWRLLVTTPLMTPLSNFTPIGAMALFGGCYYKSKWKAFLVPLFTLWLTDVTIDSFVYYHTLTWLYDGWYWTYGTFALMVVMGTLMKKVNIKNIIIACFLATFAHWMITDFGVWLSNGLDITTGKPYVHDMTGFIKCLYLALPYEKNLLIGNLVFSGILFGVFEWVQRKYPVLQLPFKPTLSEAK